MSDDVKVIRKSRGNFSSGEKRAEDGRKGRGVDAFSPKLTDDRVEINKRIDEICARVLTNNEDGSAARVSNPLFVPHVSVGARKF